MPESWYLLGCFEERRPRQCVSECNLVLTIGSTHNQETQRAAKSAQYERSAATHSVKPEERYETEDKVGDGKPCCEL